MDFHRRVVVITGAGRGVGRAHALAFAARGAAVVVNDAGGAADGDRSGPAEPVADEVVAAITASGGSALADHADVSDPSAAAGLIERAVREFGRIDVVVNNAGIDRAVALRNVTPELMSAYLAVHVLGTYQVTAAAWPHLVAGGQGRVITTTSSAGYFGLGHALPYATAKGALHGLTQALAVEGRSAGITANAVAPFARSRLAADRTRSRPELFSAIERLAPASLVSPVVLWLAHESTTVTGAAFEVGAGTVHRVFVAQAGGVQPGNDLLAESAGLATAPDAAARLALGELDRSGPGRSGADEHGADDRDDRGADGPGAVGLTPEYLRDHADEVLSTSGFEVPAPAGMDRPMTRYLGRLLNGDSTVMR